MYNLKHRGTNCVSYWPVFFLPNVKVFVICLSLALRVELMHISICKILCVCTESARYYKIATVNTL